MEADAATQGIANAMNATSSFAPSGMDLLMAIPRLARRAGAFAFYYVPDNIDSLVGKLRDGGSVIADPTASLNATITNGTGAFAQVSAGGLASATESTAGSTAETAGGLLSLQNFRNVGGVFSYMSSKWALTTFIAGIVLNRTQFYASSRIPLRLNFFMRLTLYLVPILAMVNQIYILLRAIRCQSSPDWSELRYNNSTKHVGADYAGDGGFLYSMSSSALFWEDDAASCRGVNMGGFENKNLTQLAGSLTLLWPLFLSFCLSAFVENLACALQGRQPMAETGMTTFEHSLAFAEAEAAILRPFELFSKLSPTELHPETSVSSKLTRSLAMQILNVTPEVLMVSLISTLNHLSSHVLAVLGIRNRLRLVNTGIWALAYMAIFLRTFITMTNSVDFSVNLGLLRFPTVCIIGFVPHLVILWGISVCAGIYALALVITAFAPPSGQERPQSVKERFKLAYRNLQANVYLSSGTPIVLRWQDDFYTTLLKTGFTLLTCASEAVYLNEGSPINVHRATWLEERRLDELASSKGLHQRTIDSVPDGLRGDTIAQGVSAVDERTMGGSRLTSRSGYGRERKAKAGQSLPDIAQPPIRDRGVGVFQRHGRWLLSLKFLRSIFRLCAGLHARALISVMNTVGVSYVPRWLRRVAGTRPTSLSGADKNRSAANHTMRFLILGEDGQYKLPADRNVDVEAEIRRRVMSRDPASNENIEAVLDKDLYNWWSVGGWWGDLDASGDYQPAELEDDHTSVVSTITDVSSVDDWVDEEEEEDGRRTPTRYDPFPTRESTPFSDDLLDRTRLASLLDPQSSEERHEAHLLSRRLLRDSPMTRSQYHSELDRERSRVLLSRRGVSSRTGPTSLSPEEEEKVLERFILERRDAAADRQQDGVEGAWEKGAEGMGAAGPQCVVCQSCPRTTLLWPCGCLSLCDDCRVGLATRNFNTCVCCRTGVVAYSRLYVP